MDKDEIVLEIMPSGEIRSYYDDNYLDLRFVLQASNLKVNRASNVEWETVPGGIEGINLIGWTVRASHDNDLAIREGSRGELVVAKEGWLKVFTSREEALRSELLFFWELLPPEKNSE